jgi:pyruvate dehydrogenase E1 component alpha subunit
MSGIVGSGVPHAVGAARAFKLLGKKNVGIATCGDGAMNSSGFNSSLNMAAMWKLPVVFVVHNNQYAIDCPAEIHASLTMAGRDLSQRAAGFAIPGITVDGNDLFAVHKAAKHCINMARQDNSPSMLELITYRHWAHAGPAEHEAISIWKRPEEVKYWLRRDPIPRFERQVVQGGLLSESELERVRQTVASEIEEAVKFGVNSAYPDPEKELEYYEKVLKV